MPERDRIIGFLARTWRRTAALAAVNGAAVGLLVAVLFAQVPAVGAALAAIGAGAGYAVARSRRGRIAHDVERRAPECRNVVVTASELATARIRARAEIEPLVYRDAARVVDALEIRRLFPARRALTRLGVSLTIWALAVALVVVRPTVGIGASDASGAVAAIDAIEVVVIPPAYSGRAAESTRNPARVEALEGSRLRIIVRGTASEVHLETVAGSTQLRRADGAFEGEIVVDADGFIAIEARAAAGTAARRLVGLSVTRDAAPRVRVTAPGRDLVYESAPRAIDVTLEASDDLGLATLVLRYTKVSGSGEQFTFVEGEAPLTVQRTDPRAWTARGVLPLDALALTPGDVVVYRGVASDHRPGALLSESDAFLVELAEPGAGAAGGFAIDDENDRYGVSQQMVILMTERLVAQRATLDAEAFERESRTLAAAQRRVRAEFMFMLGGELADEVEEGGLLELDEHAHAAADDDEAIAGRLANRNRIDLLRAIRAMSRAATALNESDPSRALPAEREALTLLQQAFSRSRYILRSLTERERLDLSRRLTGTLTGAMRDTRPVGVPTVNPRIPALRRVLAEVASLAGSAELTRADAVAATTLAQSALAVDPSAASMQAAALALAQAGFAIERPDASAARARLDEAALILVAAIREHLRPAPHDPPPLDARALAGALADALAARGGGQ